MHVASVYSKCFRCFIYILQMFHPNVAYTCNDYTCVFKFFLVFASVSDVRCKCFGCFERIL
jgi:hypothetical protein